MTAAGTWKVKRCARGGRPVVEFESAVEGEALRFWRRHETAVRAATFYLVNPAGLIVLSVSAP